MHRHLVVIVLVLAAPLAAESIMADVDNVPVERVVANLERRASLQPTSVEVLLNLARVHVMAFATKRETAPVHRGTGDLWFAFGTPAHKQPAVTKAPDPAREAVAREHLTRAIARYREVLVQAPANDVAQLGLGWTLAQTGDRAGAIAALREVVARAWAPDRDRNGRVMHGFQSLTEEAASYLIPLLDPQRDSAEIATLRARVTELAKQVRMITPIAIPLRDGLSAEDLTDESAAVAFDLDGSGLGRRWTWITPDAAWLVFDRRRTGRIDSGLQLFGSVTFWLFWDNGYHALQSLDDDGDGAIRGGEMDGFALWHDRNANGVSEVGEVRSVVDWGIVSLSCDYERDPRHPDEIAFSPAGVTFVSGTTRPTFNLVLHARR